MNGWSVTVAFSARSIDAAKSTGSDSLPDVSVIDAPASGCVRIARTTAARSPRSRRPAR